MNKKIIIGVALGFLLIATIGFTYAFFTTSVTGNDNAKDEVVETGTLSLVYKDGPKIELNKAKPGEQVEKVVSVTNTGTLDTSYNITLSNYINTIEKNELVISYTCKSYENYISIDNKGTETGECDSFDSQVIPLSESIISTNITEGIPIENGITHEYNITITFIETNDSQNYNQGKEFSGTLNINEYRGDIATYTINARLLDSSNNPISNATVEIYSVVKTAITDSTGNFVIENIEMGAHEFKVKDSSGNYIVEDKIKIMSSDSYNINEKVINAPSDVEKLTLDIQIDNNAIIKIDKANLLYDKILAAETPKSDASIDFATSSGKGLYYTSKSTVTEDYDGDGTGDRVYYYRGAVTNNNVRFGGFCWRIVRTNEDGSIRMRYNGTYSSGKCPSTGTKAGINSNATYAFSESIDNNKYNEYVYRDGTGQSNIKKIVENWYTSKLTNYADKIANVPYCADKSNSTKLTSGSWSGYYIYGATRRIADVNNAKPKSGAQPSYKCIELASKHTVSGDTWGGTGKLSKPIGLLTADEAVFAGSGYYQRISSVYLYTSNFYWLMSPSMWGGSVAQTYEIQSDGTLVGGNVAATKAVYPVISLIPNVRVTDTGNGSYTNPYVVE